MFLFWRLVLSHVLGDFPLQTDTIYQLKVKGKLGGLVHGLIITVLNLLLGWPYLGNKLILNFLIAIGFIHTMVDGMKINLKGRYCHGETAISFILDQLIHLAIIALSIPFSSKICPPQILSTHGLASLYYSDRFIFYSIAFIFVSFGGIIFSAALKNTFSKSIVTVNSIPLFEKGYGFVERLLITFLVMAGSNLWPVVASIAPRLVPALSKKTGGWSNFIINFSLGASIGLLLRRIYG